MGCVLDVHTGDDGLGGFLRFERFPFVTDVFELTGIQPETKPDADRLRDSVQPRRSSGSRKYPYALRSLMRVTCVVATHIDSVFVGQVQKC
jgi:hypothetical protein